MLDKNIFFKKYVFLSLAFRSSMSIDAKSSGTPISPTITMLSHVRNTVGGFNAVNDWQFSPKFRTRLSVFHKDGPEEEKCRLILRKIP